MLLSCHTPKQFFSKIVFLFFGLAGVAELRSHEPSPTPWKVEFDHSTSSGGMVTRRTGRFFAVGNLNGKIHHFESVPVEVPFHGFVSAGLKRDPIVLAHQFEEAVNSNHLTVRELENIFSQMQTFKDINQLDDIDLPDSKNASTGSLKNFKVRYGLSLSSGVNSPGSRFHFERGGLASIKTEFLITGPGLVNPGHVFSSFQITVPFHGSRFKGQMIAEQIEILLNEKKVSFADIREALSHWDLAQKLEDGLTINGIHVGSTPLKGPSVTFGFDVSSGVLEFEKKGNFVIMLPLVNDPADTRFFESFTLGIPFHGFRHQNPHALAFAFEDALKTQKIEQAALEIFLSDHNLLQKLEDGKLPGALSPADFHTGCGQDIKKVFP